MPYYQLYYHLVWSTYKRLPLLSADIEPTIHGFLRAKAVGLEATVFALDGTEDHVHLVVSIPPKIAVAKFVGQIKAVASTKFNKAHPDAPPFFWQDEYAAFSFDAKRLPNHIAYVRQQKQHHTGKTIIPILERTDDSIPQSVHEETIPYAFEDSAWRREMEAGA